MTQYDTIADTIGAEAKSFRSAAVTSENRASPFARSVFASCLSVGTLALCETHVIHAFGNPKGAKGKPVATVSGLRAFVGGAAVYQAWKSIDRILANIDADAPRDVDGVTVGDGAIRKAVVAFTLSTPDAPANLKQLIETVNGAIKAFAALTAEDNSEAEADNAPTPDEAPAPAAMTLLDRANMLLLAIQNCTDDELNDAYDTLAAISEAVNARIEADVPAELVAAD